MHSLSFYNFLHEAGDIDRIIVSLGAVLFVSIIGFVVGPIGGNANPVLWKLLDTLFGFARKSYKVERSSSSLAFRGVLFCLLYILFALVMGLAFHYVCKEMYPSLALEVLYLSLTMTGGAVWLSLSKLHQALKEGSKLEKGSYRPIALSTRTNLNTTDDFGITRVGISFMPKAFDKGLIAPLFWYLIGGLPVAYLYAGIACAAWALGKEGYAKNFGDSLLRLERIFGALPNFISGIFLMAAALFTPTARLTRAVPAIFSKAAASYAEGGFPLTVTAYALDVSLGGPVEDLEGSVKKHKWIGPKTASARVDKAYLKRAIYMSLMAYVLVIAALVAGLLAWKYYAP